MTGSGCRKWSYNSEHLSLLDVQSILIHRSHVIAVRVACFVTPMGADCLAASAMSPSTVKSG